MVDFKNPEIQEALVEALLSFKLKLKESIEFEEAVQKDFANRSADREIPEIEDTSAIHAFATAYAKEVQS